MTDESLFAAALALPAHDRAAYLAANCPDPAVRKQVEELLAAADVSNPLDRRPVDVDQTVHRTPTIPAPTAAGCFGSSIFSFTLCWPGGWVLKYAPISSP